MESAVRLASGPAGALVARLLGSRAPSEHGEELIAGLVSFRGERPSLDTEGLRDLATALVALGLEGRTLPRAGQRAVAQVLARTLSVTGELDTTDAQAVRMGPQDYARRLRAEVPGADRALTPSAAEFHDSLLVAVCLHLLHALIRRSPYLARTLPERAHRIRQLVDLADVSVLRRRSPDPSPGDAAFEARYRRSVEAEWDRVTIHGVDLRNPHTPTDWPLEGTYLSLNAEPAAGPDTPAAPPLAVPADRALSGQERVLVRGVAGSGKTTLQQWLAVRTARGTLPADLAGLEGRIPFVLPVRRFAREGFPAPDAFLSAVGHPLASAAPEGWAARVLADERALLLVDGIDEAPEAQRTAVRDQLRRLLRIYSGNACLVTSRPSAVEADWLADEGFAELTLAPMDRDQVQACVTAWHAAAAADGGRDHDRLDHYRTSLLQAIPLHRELRGLATNPLMCGLICALNRDRGGVLPHGRTELYEAAMEMLLQRRDAERRVVHADGLPLGRAPRERLLRKLAYRMLTEERPVLSRADACAELATHLPALPALTGRAAQEVFAHLLQRAGLLREQGPDGVEFVHRTVQDHLAAKEAVERGDLRVLLDHAHEPEWEEVIRMAVAHARPAEADTLLSGLIAPGRTGMQRQRRRLLAAACLEHVTELDPALHARVRRETRGMVRPTTIAGARGLGWVGPIVLEMLPDPMSVSAVEAHRLAVTATRVADDAAVDYLARMRTHPSLDVRAELARGWKNFETERYADRIIAHLATEGLYLPVTDRVELAALRRLGGREHVQVAGRLTPGELVEGLVAERLTHLWLAVDLGSSDVSWLEAFPRLTALRVNPRLPRVTCVPEGVRIVA